MIETKTTVTLLVTLTGIAPQNAATSISDFALAVGGLTDTEVEVTTTSGETE